MDQSSGVAVGRRWTETVSKSTRESRKATAGAVLGVGGLAAIKGATEVQHRAKVGATSARAGAESLAATAAAARGSAESMKGKPGAFIRNPQGQRTNRRFNAQMQREAADNLDVGAKRARTHASAVERVGRKTYKGAQRTKVGGLVAAGTGAYLGLKGLGGMNRNRREAALYGMPGA